MKVKYSVENSNQNQREDLRKHAFGGNGGKKSIFFSDLVSFPFSRGCPQIPAGNPDSPAPLSFVNRAQLESMDNSLDKVLRATFHSGEKIASAKGYLNELELNYRSVFIQQNYRSHDEFLERQNFLNFSLLNIIALTDKYEDTIGHSQLVARYSLLLAKSFGIESRQFLADLVQGALLHDIGKIGIPETILRKPGRLTEAQRKVVEEHPFLGYEMIEEYDFLRKPARVVLYHHEHYGGNGYPYGIQGDEIPLEARIFSLADTLDAITSDRPYRKGGSINKALSEIERNSGTQFDPCLVNCLLQIPDGELERIKQEPFGFSFSELTH